ncbi:MAG TPA: hypothetical protein ENN23_09900 [Deltaproteobacteria bacterium]|nr:hypothetical protein [Deltaproteobacteria bacterium]
MTSKKQRRAQAVKGRKKKKSKRMLYLFVILGSVFIVLVIFFVILFSALFPASDPDSMKIRERQAVIIYFSDDQERFLIPEERYVMIEHSKELQVEKIVKAMLEGSKTGLINTFPAGVTLLGVEIDDEGTALVSFDKNLINLHPGGSAAEMATIYSLTNSVTENVIGVKKVKILVEGKALPSIKGHISTKDAFRPAPELIVKSQEAKN